jgi:hypothetical protein
MLCFDNFRKLFYLCLFFRIFIMIKKIALAAVIAAALVACGKKTEEVAADAASVASEAVAVASAASSDAASAMADVASAAASAASN